jgi:hypothetical protein
MVQQSLMSWAEFFTNVDLERSTIEKMVDDILENKPVTDDNAQLYSEYDCDYCCQDIVLLIFDIAVSSDIAGKPVWNLDDFKSYCCDFAQAIITDRELAESKKK